jgi:UDP-N-acetylmuramate--alanine ligase
MAERLERPFVTYGLFPRQADVRARSTDLRPGGSTFEVEWRGRPMGTVRLAVPGLHNVRNALAVIAALRLMEMDFADIARGLAEYRGVARRFELAGEESGVRVIDDYAHHPTEIQATLAAARGLGASGRVIALFQPHRYSRSKILAEEFGGAFDAADVALIADIYSAGERPIEGVDASLIFDSVRRHGHPFAWRARTLEDAAEWLASEVRSGDVVLTLGAGDVWKAGRKLLDLLRSEPAAEAETLARVAAEAV